MKIKRLEIIGFKSFVDKVSLEFPAGITGVVGPNGCGKSNIVDAIRWVIGEQSARNLRGKSMEDVIFGGSESRKPLGMAEVSIVFSAEDGRVPVKYLSYSEIQVTRRYYRDGESEYLLNKTPCRLLDITELFMDTGVGAKAYSIIEQGKIGMILHAKPEERRFLIEEAAGVTKFKSRKKVALKKIEVTRQNLVRLSDIVGEIRRQLAALQRQAKRAEKFREYREELREIELKFAAARFTALSREKGGAEARLAALNEQATGLAAELAKGELVLEEARIALLEEEQSLTTSQEEMFRLKGESQALENRREFLRKELENLDRQRIRAGEELAGLERRLAEAEAERKGLENQKGLFITEMGEEEGRLAAAEKVLEELTDSERELGARLEESRRSLFSLLSEAAQLGNRHATALKRIAGIDEKLERSSREALQLREKLAEVGAQVAALEAAVASVLGRKGELSEEQTLLRNRESELRERLSTLEREFQAGRDELSRKASRLHSLQELEARFEGYGQGVRALLLAERFKGRFKGVVADFVETGEEHEAALEAVLGERLQHIVAGDPAEALEGIAFLREGKGGRGSFLLPLALPAAAGSLPPAVTPLLAKVKVAPPYREMVEPLLRNVGVVATLAEGVALAAEHPTLTFVTSDGDLVAPGGVVTGGSLEGAQHGLVHKKREIKELSLLVAELSARVKGLEEVREQLKHELTAAEERGRELRQALHQEELRLVNNEKDLQRAREERKRVEERIALQELEDDRQREERDLLAREAADAAQGMAAGEERKVFLEEETTLFQSQLEAKKHALEEARARVTSLKVQVASLRERRESNLRAITRLEHLIAELRTGIEGHRQELDRGAEEHGRLADAIAAAEEEIRQLLERGAVAEAVFVKLKERYEERSCGVREDETRLRERRSALDEVRHQASGQQLTLTELASNLRHLEQSVTEKYRTPLADILPRFREEEFAEAAQKLRQEELEALVDSLGEVNLLAIEEHRQMEERHTFLVTQQQDLQESLDALQSAIHKINRTTRKRFQETFQQVNAKFQDVFPRLFCGGRGELRLTGEEDLLECGIDIVVEPPGKKLQSVTLLSGGEKALTAVALIFSIFLIKPTPFCLLDEVDAPLDDANIGRFNEMVREMSKESQFIIITHNRNTMAVADTLYGVTMEEAGVSKTVSVKLQ